ncbi:hypothetical protein PF005_g17353 [Phytophthora fragariae]|uniref:RxLR effector protein n=2 Tax=Phytophthora TaxID=4783 RepID=A0A6A3Y039_9STRA|nr:hypothetical protein PF003_g25167 [Phytophthora fragariae]KAE9016395.1 hypothetical protein PR002_g13673 [Phytophthora rubi]KAE8931500.1 hypothetical protein PF009_g18445 [Phytophthora fragariae]KAE8995085.1 hypothetical protein PF011_g16482 [Phytophthora fragariae]KAE9021438.1 hypothetical protein PR001_g13371 [Phytophthora rubi]
MVCRLLLGWVLSTCGWWSTEGTSRSDSSTSTTPQSGRPCSPSRSTPTGIQERLRRFDGCLHTI